MNTQANSPPPSADKYVWVSNHVMPRIASIRREGKSLGDRRQIVTLRNGDVYTIEQIDRDYYEVNGPHLTQCRVAGWLDGAKLINGI